MREVVEVGYYEPGISANAERKRAAELRRQYNRAVKQHGGNWRCRGGCGRIISANKVVCMKCGLKGVVANAVDMAAASD